MSKFQPQSQQGSAEEQIDSEVTVTQAKYVIAGMFGAEYQHQSGGGGGGHFELSLTDLDEIIAEVKFEADDIARDGETIRQAIGLVEPPANDIMSRLQAQATTNSWEAAFQYNQRMLTAANAELDKLEAARKSYVQVEDANTDSMRKQG